MAHLRYSQRLQIAEGIQQGKSNAQIAHELNVHRSTIGREIQRNAESREQYAAHYAQREYLVRRTDAAALRFNFGNGVRLFYTLEKRNKIYTFLSKSHTAFFIPSSYLRLEWSNDLLYSGPIDSHIYSVSRVPDYRLSNIIRLVATGIILPYEKKSGDKYIFRPGQGQGASLSENYKVNKISKRAGQPVRQEGKKNFQTATPTVKDSAKNKLASNQISEETAAFLYFFVAYHFPYTFSCPSLLLLPALPSEFPFLPPTVLILLKISPAKIHCLLVKMLSELSQEKI